MIATHTWGINNPGEIVGFFNGGRGFLRTVEELPDDLTAAVDAGGRSRGSIWKIYEGEGSASGTLEAVCDAVLIHEGTDDIPRIVDPSRAG